VKIPPRTVSGPMGELLFPEAGGNGPEREFLHDKKGLGGGEVVSARRTAVYLQKGKTLVGGDCQITEGKKREVVGDEGRRVGKYSIETSAPGRGTQLEQKKKKR